MSVTDLQLAGRESEIRALEQRLDLHLEMGSSGCKIWSTKARLEQAVEAVRKGLGPK